MPGYFCLIDSVSSQGFPVTTFLVFCLNIQQLLWLSPALWLLVFPRFTFLNPLNLCGGETTNSGCNWNNNHLPSSLVLFLTTTVIAGQQKCFMNNCRFFTRNIEKHYSGGHNLIKSGIFTASSRTKNPPSSHGVLSLCEPMHSHDFTHHVHTDNLRLFSQPRFLSWVPRSDAHIWAGNVCSEVL